MKTDGSMLQCPFYREERVEQYNTGKFHTISGCVLRFIGSHNTYSHENHSKHLGICIYVSRRGYISWLKYILFGSCETKKNR